MMGEFLLLLQGRLFGGIYGDRLLVKPVEVARAYMPEAELKIPIRVQSRCFWWTM